MSENTVKVEERSAPITKSTALIFKLLQDKQQQELAAAVETVRADAGFDPDANVTLDLTRGLWVFPPALARDE